MRKPFLAAVCCTYNRHYHLERLVRYFLDQDYDGDHLLLIFNNHPVEQSLDKITLPRNKRVMLVNQHLSFKTGRPYESLGAIYTDAITHLPGSTEVMVFTDDDDVLLPHHFSEGVKGWQKAREKGMKAWKPYYSYHRDTEWNTALTRNTLEPSIFVSYDHVIQYGFSDTTVDQHLQWVTPLGEQHLLLDDVDGRPSLIYTWMGDVFKTSGNPNPQNFNNCRNFSGDIGDLLITPASKEEVQKWYQI